MTVKPEVDAATLRRIADALGVPVAHLYDAPHPSRTAGALELLTIWDALPTDAARERVLALARAVAAEAGGGRSPAR